MVKSLDDHVTPYSSPTDVTRSLGVEAVGDGVLPNGTLPDGQEGGLAEAPPVKVQAPSTPPAGDHRRSTAHINGERNRMIAQFRELCPGKESTMSLATLKTMMGEVVGNEVDVEKLIDTHFLQRNMGSDRNVLPVTCVEFCTVMVACQRHVFAQDELLAEASLTQKQKRGFHRAFEMFSEPSHNDAGEDEQAVFTPKVPACLAHMGFYFSTKQIRQLIDRVDDSGNGTIEINEFMVMGYWCLKLKQQDKRSVGLHTFTTSLVSVGSIIAGTTAWLISACDNVVQKSRWWQGLKPYERSHYMKKALCGPIDPSSALSFRWNMVTLVLVLLCAWLVPTRLGFNTQPTSFSTALDIFVECWFIVSDHESCMCTPHSDHRGCTHSAVRCDAQFSIRVPG